MSELGILSELAQIGDRVQEQFERERRLLSFQQYLELFAQNPQQHSRDAARYLRDMFDYYGRAEVVRPWGRGERLSLFDLPFLDPPDAARHALVGQEQVQTEIYRVLNNFVREGRPNRVILTHGPNGSAKSTLAACIMRGLEHYSTLAEGALYRFHWVFPNRRTLRGTIGFQGQGGLDADRGSYAFLPDEQVDTRLQVEVRDHPLFLLPQPERSAFLAKLYARANVSEQPPDWVVRGGLSHKSREVYEALLADYKGSLEEVLRHVQVERYFISRRYRVGAVTLGPELSVDVAERQVTADRSFAALPTSLQSASFYELHGELLDAAGGLLEFSDLLKRPIDAFKYLQITAETGEVALSSQTLQTNCVMLASANDLHLTAFREHPEFESFRGRLELIRVPYLLSYLDEARIYDSQIAPQVRRHVAPHAIETAAMFAVMSRLTKPNVEGFESETRRLLQELTVTEKMDLYARGSTPPRLDEKSARLLRAAVPDIHTRDSQQPSSEGALGASPREIKAVLLDAAQNPAYSCLSPWAVLEQLERLCQRRSEYAWLQRSAQPGGYADQQVIRNALRARVLDVTEDEFRAASGLVDETRYAHLFDRYITHVSYWVKKEKVQNPVTGVYEDPDERLMSEVERLLGRPDDAAQLRSALINRVAAWAIGHPDQSVDNAVVFAAELQQMRQAVFAERRGAIERLTRDLLLLVREEGVGLDTGRRAAAEGLATNLRVRYGYEVSSAGDAALVLLKERFR